MLRNVTLGSVQRFRIPPNPPRAFRVTQKGMVLEHGHKTRGVAEQAISGGKEKGTVSTMPTTPPKAAGFSR